MRWGTLASCLALLAGCRINPQCFGSSECPENTYCFEQECVPMAPDGGTYTWWDDVEPIVRDNCQVCHDTVPMNGAPVSLVSYGDVTAQASTGVPMHRAMYTRVSSEEAPMPRPPLPALSTEEIEIFKVWTREGAPEGEPPFTWVKDIEPIVSNNCLGCHSDPPQNMAPFPLVRWENTQMERGTRRVHQIMAERVADMMRSMPPTGQLPIGQINLIGAWSRIGGPRGSTDGGIPMPSTPNPLENAGAVLPMASPYVFLEGPDWNEQDNVLVFADVLADTIYQLTPPSTVEPIRSPSGRANGLRFGRSFELVAAEHESRSITRMTAQGVETVVSRYDGNRFNSPNDVVVRLSDGTIYFTDPPLGLDGRTRELSFNGLFRVAPGGGTTAEWQGPEGSEPNGLELSPDEGTLYMSDSVDALVRAFDVNADGSLTNERVFAYTEPRPDGIAPDEDGNIFVATQAGIQAFASNGYIWGTIPIPEPPTNLAFGGTDRRTLYVTTITTVYAIAVQIPGTRWNRGGVPDGGMSPLTGVGPAQAFGPMTYQFLEGPDWDRVNGRLVYSDIPAETVYEHRPPNEFLPLRTASNMTNGLFVEPAGTILMCEHGSRTLTRFDPANMQVTPVVENYQGLMLNSPNDVVVRSDGTIYFSDPDYGLAGRPRGVAFHGVYRRTPAGVVTADWEAPTTVQPNGLVFSPDEDTLYVTDSAGARVYRFDVAGDGSLTGMALFIDAEGTLPDGLAVDRNGNVYLASSAGIEVYAPDGMHWGNIAVAAQPSNLVFGGAAMRTLYITTASQLYRVDVPIPAP